MRQEIVEILNKLSTLERATINLYFGFLKTAMEAQQELHDQGGDGVIGDAFAALVIANLCETADELTKDARTNAGLGKAIALHGVGYQMNKKTYKFHIMADRY